MQKDSSTWGPVEFSPVEEQGLQTASTYDWGAEPGTSTDFFSSMMTDSKQVKHGPTVEAK